MSLLTLLAAVKIGNITDVEVPFAEVHGTLVRNGIIHRQKKYKDDNGKVIFEGKQVKR